MTLYEKVSANAEQIIEQLKRQGTDSIIDHAGMIYFNGILTDVCSDLIDEDNQDFYQCLIDYKGNVVKAIWEFYLDRYESSNFFSFDSMTQIIDDFINYRCNNKDYVNWRI